MGKFERIGEVRTMHNGLSARIIEYYRYSNITVEFENGMRVYNKHYHEFERGQLKSPLVLTHVDDYVDVYNPNLKFSFMIDADDLYVLDDTSWWKHRTGYIHGRVNGKYVALHRYVMRLPEEMEVDHVNFNLNDCRKSQLRICSTMENRKNTRIKKHNTSTMKGVTWHKRIKKWQARITSDKNRIHLGYFDTPEEAACVYNEKAIELHGEFARLNTI